MLHLASKLSDAQAVRGHLLALRVFPENDFGAYRTLWHRDPAGR
jgi:hypothetical protein